MHKSNKRNVAERRDTMLKGGRTERIREYYKGDSMTDNRPPQTAILPKRVSIQDRSVLVDDFIVVNGFKVNRTSLKQRFAQGGYQAQETTHFLLFTRQEAPSTIIVHAFAPETPPTDIEHCVVHELQPLGLLKRPGDQKTLLQGLLDSFQMGEIQMLERSVPVGDLFVMNSNGLNQRALKRRLLQSGYQVQETPHFFYCTREKAPATILVHWFALDDLHTNISRHLVEEMRPFGCIPNNLRLGEFMTGIVGTTFPENVRRAWNYFGANTLQRLLLFVSTAAPEILPDYGTLEASATLYQRVCELCVGERFLDAGCNNGFFALLLAERRPFVTEVIGVDIDQSIFHVAQELATTRNVSNVHYAQADLLSEDDVGALGAFDTVTALHVLEHFSEAEMYGVLRNLLQVTTHRLILAVPYEEELTVAYDHRQCFSRAKLEAVGAWCIEQLQGQGRLWCEDLCGGLLLLERRPSLVAH
jgi:SAM-dependent methyltransferase